MQKIIFERLTVKEEERVSAGNTSSNSPNTTSASAKNCTSTNPTSVGNGCLLEIITTNDKLNCAVANSELNCGYEVKIKLGCE
jgi:hypothetical protein